MEMYDKGNAPTRVLLEQKCLMGVVGPNHLNVFALRQNQGPHAWPGHLGPPNNTKLFV